MFGKRGRKGGRRIKSPEAMVKDPENRYVVVLTRERHWCLTDFFVRGSRNQYKEWNMIIFLSS